MSLNSVAIGGTIFVSVIVILLDAVHFDSPIRLKHLLQVAYAASADAESALQRVLHVANG